MLLRDWRQIMNLTIREGARYLGLTTFGFLSKMENGLVFPSPATIATIEGATHGKVTVVDHLEAWRQQHLQQFKDFRAAGRAAAKAYRPPAKPKTGAQHGRASKRVGR